MGQIIVPKNNTYVPLLKYTGLFGIKVDITEYDESNWLIVYADTDGEKVCAAIEEHESYNMSFPDSLQSEMMANADKELTAGLNAYIDGVAQMYRYDDMKSARSYAGFENAFQAQALRLAQWSTDCWVKAGEIEQEVLAGSRDMPTLDEVIAEFPEYTE